MSLRHINQVIIIDRSTDAIVWVADNVTIGQHQARMIEDTMPGAGNILVFDNGMSRVFNNPGEELVRAYSRVLEIDPLSQALPYNYDARQSGRPTWEFFSHFAGGSQRLPNGNTLITEATNGRIFEVTPLGEIVWEYVAPFTNGTDRRVYRAEKAWFWIPSPP